MKSELRCISKDNYIKREDLLPYGGGNKVRRLLQWMQSHPLKPTIVAFSDQGSHTFWTLLNLLNEKTPIESLIFLERHRPLTPYDEKIRSAYCQHPKVTVKQGPTLFLWLMFLYYKCFKKNKTSVLGIGSNLPSSTACYEDAMRECIDQLGSTKTPVNHIFPISSGNMADGFLAHFEKENLSQHTLYGVMTGPWISRLFLRLKYFNHPKIHLRNSSPLKWQDYQSIASQCHLQANSFPDPTHGIHAWCVFQECSKDRINIFWATYPLHK